MPEQGHEAAAIRQSGERIDGRVPLQLFTQLDRERAALDQCLAKPADLVLGTLVQDEGITVLEPSHVRVHTSKPSHDAPVEEEHMFVTD